MKILSINNFTTKFFSKLLSDLYIGFHVKGTKKFGSKVINRQFFHRKTVFSNESMYCLLLSLLPNFLASKITFQMHPNRKITKKFIKKFTKKFDSKVINRQYFHRKTRLKS
jgi:hypothetical protein